MLAEADTTRPIPLCTYRQSPCQASNLTVIRFFTQVLLRPTVVEPEGEGDVDYESNSDTDDDMPLLDRQLGAIADRLKAANTRPPPPRPRQRSRGGMGGPDGGGRRRTGRSMYRGVSWNSAAGKWRSHVGYQVRPPVVLHSTLVVVHYVYVRRHTCIPSHMKSRRARGTKEPAGTGDTCSDSTLALHLSRPRALEQATWVPCLTITVIFSLGR